MSGKYTSLVGVVAAGTDFSRFPGLHCEMHSRSRGVQYGLGIRAGELCQMCALRVEIVADRMKYITAT